MACYRGYVCILGAALVVWLGGSTAAAQGGLNLELSGIGPGPTPTDRLGRGACVARVDLVKQALQQNADPNASTSIADVEGPPLFLAAACLSKGEHEDQVRVDVARVLVEAGAKLDLPGVIRFHDASSVMAPHIAAAYTRRPMLLAYLLSLGAPVDGGDMARDGSALLWAAEGSCVPCVDILVQRGAAVERRNVMGLTPLFVAAGRGDDVMVAKLLASGASPFAKEAMAKSVLDAAGNEPTRNLLRAARRRIVATYMAWALAVMFAIGAGLFYWLRQEQAAPS